MTIPDSYEPIVRVTRRFGAYLITMQRNDITQDWGYIEMVDCAGSLITAKRVSRDLADDVCEPGSGYRWENETGGAYVLYGRLADSGDY